MNPSSWEKWSVFLKHTLLHFKFFLVLRVLRLIEMLTLNSTRQQSRED